MDRARYEALISPALAMVVRKGLDYNNGGEDDLHTYFPFGTASYAQMIHVKSMRFVSLAKQDKVPNYESAKDTLLDLINYCVFALDALEPKYDPAMNAVGKSFGPGGLNEKL